MIRKYEIVETADGSHTLKLVDTDITFHSKKGAIQESLHVFIQSGFDYFARENPTEKVVKIFEVGLGTGLNALLTAKAARKKNKQVVYKAVDLYPLGGDIFNLLNYPQILDEIELYRAVMQTGWEQLIYVNPFFKLQKIRVGLEQYTFTEPQHIIYFDAFAPEDQEEMWTEPICKKMFDALESRGVLVTYCSKSVVRRALVSAGFMVEKIPGPPGKREIVRAIKS
ncbi:tRNA (5-methylaminomethyl-2-thiouridine)(34)-methyltransferase MnmD [Niabella yanshanensis]|uniref:tRNA (5-methylaminomethyl-2-thiouridine)(34)-methyltransferase MnmD n=1 Tax=Niabella yanshanensis TaxID=577386 RepID=A0ABZ0W8H4_9BACT|nr:tRNA (5-methylaminomethyl-2-thiouridine)(34)-methyltransferase MnmD [Niabella yanshanensis]WQD39578.1 tRNA (5-methylaminomethyl-2-thiouridine)(34)-methyltransferase MnmD [Niabella yanshanensis]